MAIGTISKPSTYSSDGVVGNKRSRTRDVILTSGANYVTGGSAITPQAVGMNRRIERVTGAGSARTTSGGAASIPISVEHQTDGSVKLQAYVASTGAEQGSNADMSTFSIRLTFVGV